MSLRTQAVSAAWLSAGAAPAADATSLWRERQLHAAAAVAAMASQIELASREAQPRVERLALGLTVLTRTLPVLADSADREAIPDPRPQLDECIRSLQCFDRMTQHLAQICSFLTAVHMRLAAAVDEPAGAGGETSEQSRWDAMRSDLRRRLLSDAQRELLDLLLPPAGGSIPPLPAAEGRLSEGTVELF